MSVWLAHWPQGGTRIEAVVSLVKGRIAARALAVGDRLPSVRALSSLLAVSPSTVVEAYERLAGEGVIRSRPGSGFYVAGPPVALALAEVGPRLDRAVDPLWVSRQSLAADAAAAMPGCGWLPPDWMPQAALRRAVRQAGRDAASTLTDYATPLGSEALRQVLARRLAERGTLAAPGQILLAESGTHAIDLVCRLLIEPGDAVLVDDPCYFNFHALLRAHRARVVAVPYTPSGPDLAAFAQALRVHQPRLYITNSGPQNPTGAILSAASAHRVLAMSEAAGLVIVEDDIFCDFEREPSPRLAALDGLARVIAIGSFSKTLSAAARCGFIAARGDWIDRLIDLKIATSFGGGRLAQAIVLSLLTSGAYRKHVEQLRPRLAQAMERTIVALGSVGLRPWLRPQAGMFVWCRLPDGVDAARVARSCLAEGVVLAPGNAFSLSQSAAGFLRFNVAQSGDARLPAALDRAIRAART